VASPAGRLEVDVFAFAGSRPAIYLVIGRAAGGGDGPAEPRMGAPSHPGRTGSAGPSDRVLDRVGDLEEGRDRSRAAAQWPDLGEFLSAQAQRIIACDFLHVDTVLLRRLYVLIFIEHGTRRLHIAGVTANPTGSWVAQQSRNLAMDLGARMDTFRFVIRDRDGKYTLAVDSVFDAEGIRVIQTPPRAPRANAICERVVGTLRRELLDRVLILGPVYLRRVLAEYAIHYNAHRPHQSLGQRSPDTDPAVPAPIIDLAGTQVRRRPILGGLINEYEAA